jgi:hypothetical protein
MFISEADVDGVDMTRETPLLSNLQAERLILRVHTKSETSESISTAKGLAVMVSPSPQSKDEENEKLHELRRYARDFRRQHTTDAERFDWDSDDGDYGLAIGRLVVT